MNINKNVNIPVVLFEELSVKRLLSVFEEENEIVFIIKYDGKFVGGITQGDFKRALKKWNYQCFRNNKYKNALHYYG